MIDVLKPTETQGNFVFTVPGQNLEKNNIVFLVKNIVDGFLDELDFLIEGEEKELGRHKNYETNELLGLVVLGILNNTISCRGLEKWAKNNDETCTYILNSKKQVNQQYLDFFKEKNY